MEKQIQLSFFDDYSGDSKDIKAPRSGTFVDNMTLPIHRWFRYSAGFSAEWVEKLLENWKINNQHVILDPFAGSGTVSIVCDKLGLKSIGVEAHPTVARIYMAKLYWASSIGRFLGLAEKISREANGLNKHVFEYPNLIQRSFDPEFLAYLDALKSAWALYDDQSTASELVWLAITAILRLCSKAGTAQWQYILPNRTKKKVVHPIIAFRQQVEMMRQDMHWMQSRMDRTHATVISGDARNCAQLIDEQVDVVITSPPYANNYDYADALRFEMTFWGEVSGWGDIHDKVRKHLIVSSSQHSSRERLKIEDLVSSPLVNSIRPELASVVNELAIARENYGGKKHYHTMVAAYCRDIAMVLRELRRVCRPDSQMCWVVGDSAPYGIYCPIDQWIGKLAVAEGFKAFEFEKIRDRNIKWKNRKHRIPLKEGFLWIKG